jgi:hypothetical protein
MAVIETSGSVTITDFRPEVALPLDAAVDRPHLVGDAGPLRSSARATQSSATPETALDARLRREGASPRMLAFAWAWCGVIAYFALRTVLS